MIHFLRHHLELREMNDVVGRRKAINTLQWLKIKVNNRRTNHKYTIAGLTGETTLDTFFNLIDREGDVLPQWPNLIDYFREKWGKTEQAERDTYGVLCVG